MGHSSHVVTMALGVSRRKRPSANSTDPCTASLLTNPPTLDDSWQTCRGLPGKAWRGPAGENRPARQQPRPRHGSAPSRAVLVVVASVAWARPRRTTSHPNPDPNPGRHTAGTAVLCRPGIPDGAARRPAMPAHALARHRTWPVDVALPHSPTLNATATRGYAHCVPSRTARSANAPPFADAARHAAAAAAPPLNLC